MLSASVSSRSDSLDDEADNGPIEVAFMGERLAIALRPTSRTARALTISVTQSHASAGHTPLALGGWARDMSHRAGSAVESPTPCSDTVAQGIEIEADQHDLVLEVTCAMGIARHLDLWLRIGRHVLQLGSSSEGAAHWLDPGRPVRLRWLVPLFGAPRKSQSSSEGYDQIVRIVARHRRHSSDANVPPHSLFYASTSEKTAEAVVAFVTRRRGFRDEPTRQTDWWRRIGCWRTDAHDI